MAQKEEIQPFEFTEFLADACEKKKPVIASAINEGKWQRIEFTVNGIFPDCIAFSSTHADCEYLKAELPIGICIHLDHFKYLFDTTIHSVKQQGQFWQVFMDMPDRVERVQRRMYHRHPVPDSMKVKVQFWHRGYLSGETEDTPEEIYWQGQLLNLSAGGAQFEIESGYKNHFKMGQLLGIQFTPISYQMPLLLESHVRYLKETSSGLIKIGVEFLGLEASSEGRETLNRILDVISEYEEMNQYNQHTHA